MGLVSEWLGTTPLEDFRQTTLGKAPIARPSAATSVVDACTWESLDRILRREPAADVLVVSRGRALDVPAPRSLAELHTLFTRGVGIVVRDAEHCDDALSDLTRGVLEDLPGKPRVLVFATPRGTHGFGWHYDAEEVFIVQTAGDKEYLLQANTVAPRNARGAQPDFGMHRLERSPRAACRLLPSDWLYIPSGHWHVAIPHADSLSVSIGIFPDDSARAR